MFISPAQRSTAESGSSPNHHVFNSPAHTSPANIFLAPNNPHPISPPHCNPTTSSSVPNHYANNAAPVNNPVQNLSLPSSSSNSNVATPPPTTEQTHILEKPTKKKLENLLATILTKLESHSKDTSTIKEVILAQQKPSGAIEDGFNLPVTNIANFDALELSLTNDETLNKLVKRNDYCYFVVLISKIIFKEIGTKDGGRKKSVKMAWDKLATPSVLQDFNWSGNSRKDE